MDKRDPYLFVVAALWLSIPVTALHYWRAWDELPLRVATHFDANWQPNGWSSREGALTLSLGMLGLVLGVLTPTSLLVRARKPGHAWPVVIIGYVTVGILCWASNTIVTRNLP
jgi:uncharacterized membrane protein